MFRCVCVKQKQVRPIRSKIPSGTLKIDCTFPIITALVANNHKLVVVVLVNCTDEVGVCKYN